MKQAAQTINTIELRKFAPLNQLSNEDAQELLRTSISIQLSPGTPVFTQDNMDKQLFYLIKGKIELRGSDSRSVIEAGTRAACQPIGRHLPGQQSAKAIEESVLISFDADMLDLFLNWTNPNAYVVNEMKTGKNHDWMNRLLQSRGLLRFSESQIHTLLERMNEIHVNAGDTVVSQDNDDDFYYVIKKGSATVSRKPDASAKPIKLAELGEGDAFGEESLLTSTTRGATVTMQEDGDLMRLSKKDFSELLAQPLLSTISWDEAQAMAATGGLFIDIRLQDEFKAMSIPGSVNVPLPVLRLKLKSLKQNRKYIIYCDDGSRSSVAAFLLNRHGFDAFVLDGGIASAIPHLALREMMPEPTEEIDTGADNTDKDQAAATRTQQTKQGNSYCSLADYWGSTVDQVSDEGFTDSTAVYQVEKTKLTPAKPGKASVTELKPRQKASRNKATTAVEKPVIKQESEPPISTAAGRSHTLRNTLIGLAVLGAGAIFAANHFVAEEMVSGKPVPAALESGSPVPQATAPVTPPAPTATPAIEPAPAINEPAETAVEAQPPQLDTSAGAGTLIESDVYLTQDGEELQLQPTTPAPEGNDTTEQPVLDPATRGFIK